MAGPCGHIHAATLTSPRLQRVLRLLSDGRPHTIRSIIRKAHVAAVNAIVAELRHHGAEITCARSRATGGVRWRFSYTMTKAPRT